MLAKFKMISIAKGFQKPLSQRDLECLKLGLKSRTCRKSFGKCDVKEDKRRKKNHIILSLFLSLCFFVCLLVCLSLSLSLPICLSNSLPLSFSLSLTLSLPQSLFLVPFFFTYFPSLPLSLSPFPFRIIIPFCLISLCLSLSLYSPPTPRASPTFSEINLIYL